MFISRTRIIPHPRRLGIIIPLFSFLHFSERQWEKKVEDDSAGKRRFSSGACGASIVFFTKHSFRKIKWFVILAVTTEGQITGNKFEFL